MRMKQFAILFIIVGISACGVLAEGLSAAEIFAGESGETKTLEPPKDSRLFVGAKINPHYKIDCKKSSNTYDPYYCGLRNSPEIMRFSAPRAGVTFTF